MPKLKEKAYTKVTEKDFVAIKKMLEAGMRAGAIADILGRSYPTIARVKKHETFTAYKAKPIKQVETVVEEATQEPELTPVTLMEAEMLQVLTNINDNLNAMTARLDWLTNNVAVPKKRFSF